MMLEQYPHEVVRCLQARDAIAWYGVLEDLSMGISQIFIVRRDPSHFLVKLCPQSQANGRSFVSVIIC